MKVLVDYELCEGHGECVIAAPEVFDMNEDGDKVVLLYWAKLDKTDDGSNRIASAQVQLAAAPYTQVFGEGAELTPEWKLYQVAGTADKDYPAGKRGSNFYKFHS